jgi:hypothetical protein
MFFTIQPILGGVSVVLLALASSSPLQVQAQRTVQVDGWTALLGPKDEYFNPADPCGGKGYANHKWLAAFFKVPRVCQFGRPLVVMPSDKGNCLHGYTPQKQGNAIVCAANPQYFYPFLVSLFFFLLQLMDG